MSPPNTPFLQEGSSSTSSQETSFDVSPVSHTHTVGALTDDNSFSGLSSASSQVICDPCGFGSCTSS
ncbi:hypothetical protein AMECASPLE_035867 [Ameca splendens]|uniref:Uncharacterized protein n=1 Tax=Ameca splendens TaxID=208324 RepID=A0ABV0Y7L5_9TELE